jgi:hypothetical protein
MGVFIAYGKGKLRFMDRVFEKSFFIILRPLCRGGANEEAIFKFCIEDEHPGATIFNDKFEFRCGQSPVEGNKDCTDFRKGEEDFEVWMAIVKEDGNPIPFLDSSSQKKMAELIGA